MPLTRTATDEDDELTYTPRSEEELLQLEELVKSAVGYDEERGDLIEIANMQFADFANPNQPLADDGRIFGFEKEEIMRLAELLVLGVVAGLVLLLVVKPLLSRLLEPTPAIAGDVDGALGEEVSGRHALEDRRRLGGNPLAVRAASGDGALVPVGAAGELGELTSDGAQLLTEDTDSAGLEQLIDVQKVEGQVRASSLRKIGEIIDRHPDEAVTILRNWLHQEI